jgi:putrescine transport system permease protein
MTGRPPAAPAPQLPDSVVARVWRWLLSLWLWSRVGGIARLLRGRTLVTAVPFGWLLLFFLVPFAIVLKISLAQSALAQPPFSSLVEWADGAVLQIRLNLANYRFLFEDPLYVSAYLSSLKVAAVATVLCLLLGYPMAYAIARARPGLRGVLLLLIILPFWTSFLLRVYAWIGLLKPNGPINGLLLWLGLIDAPLALLHSDFAVYLGIVYSYLPFMVLPLYATLVRLDPALLEAAADLGCRPFRAFLSVTLPLSIPGVIAGSMLVFIPAVGEFVIPDLLGGPNTLMIGKVLWSEFFSNRDWPLASAVAVAMLLFLVVPVVLFQRAQERQAAREHP